VCRIYLDRRPQVSSSGVVVPVREGPHRGVKQGLEPTYTCCLVGYSDGDTVAARYEQRYRKNHNHALRCHQHELLYVSLRYSTVTISFRNLTSSDEASEAICAVHPASAELIQLGASDVPLLQQPVLADIRRAHRRVCCRQGDV